MILVQTLPLTVLLLVVECAVGGALVLLFTDFEGRVSPGFLISSGVFLTVAGGIAYLLKFGYGTAAESIGWYVAGFTVSLGAYVALVALQRRSVARVVSVISITFGSAVLIQSAALEPANAGFTTVVGIAFATWVTGAALAALLLGHWYLVTPLLSSRSLTRVTDILLAGLVAQTLFFLVETASSGAAGTALDRFLAVAMSAGFVFWFRVMVGTVFPLGLTVLTRRACQLRAMQTATGFLYIIFGCVAAGDVAAKVFTFLTSVAI